MRRSFYVQLLAGNLALVLLTILLAGLVARYLLEDRYAQREKDFQQRSTALAAEVLREHWTAAPLAARRETYDRLCKLRLGSALGGLPPAAGDLRVTIIAMDGEVLGDSSPMPAADMKPHDTPDRPEVMAALRGAEGWDQRTSETVGVPFQYHARPLLVADEQVAVVRTAMSVEQLTASEGFVLRSLLLGAGAGLAVVAVLGVWLNWMWYRPLREVAQAAASVAAGELHGAVRIHGAAELEALAAALNHMRESIARQMETIAEQRAKLDTVIRSLQDGIVTTDTEDRLVLVNRAAAEMLDLRPEEGIGRNIQRVLRYAPLIDAYRACRQEGRPQRCEVSHERAGRTVAWQVSVQPVQDASEHIGFVIVLHDMTEIAHTMRMRTQFIENASHELRTPLAAVRAAVDSVEHAETPEEYRKLAAILDRQVGQLEAFTRDLLDFSSIQQYTRPLELSQIMPVELAQWARENYVATAEEKGLTFQAQAAEGGPAILSDRRLVGMVLQNLLDNAVRYTPSGGEVFFEAETDEAGLLLRVKDTGIGISPEDQQRVFERFYQAEYARTGHVSIRGTGLGLAIVKHAAERLGGSVQLTSDLGKGTIMEVRVPSAVPSGRSAH